MASIFNRNGILYMEYYDKAIKAGKIISLKLRDNRENRRIANGIKKKFESEVIPVYKLQNKKIDTPKFTELWKKYHSEKVFKEGTLRILGDVKRIVLGTLGDKEITEYKAEDNIALREYYLKMGHSQNTQSIRNRMLRCFFSWCIKREVISKNPIENIKIEIKPIEIIPPKEFEELLIYAKSRNKEAYYFIKFLELTGFRRSTALELKWEQINFKEKIIIADNVKKDRMFEFPLTDELIKLFEEMRIKEVGRVFNYKKDGLKFWYRYQRALKFSKLYGLHQIRKTFISRLVNEKYSLYDVAILADHRSITTTMKHYSKANINRIREQLNGEK